MTEESKLEVISNKKVTYIVTAGEDKFLYIVNHKAGSKPIYELRPKPEPEPIIKSDPVIKKVKYTEE